MPALKGQGRCWIHAADPATAEARARARSRAGKARRKPVPLPLTGAPPVPPPVPFDLPRVERKGDIADRLLRVVQAVASGTLDARRGRLLIEGLRSANEAWDASTPTGDDEAPAGARAATPAELRFIAENHGVLPPGVLPHESATVFWVRGDVWEPDHDSADEKTDATSSLPVLAR